MPPASFDNSGMPVTDSLHIILNFKIYYSPQIEQKTTKLKTQTIQVLILSPAALRVKLNICCDTCFIALLPVAPARATSFRVGYIASNLSVA